MKNQPTHIDTNALITFIEEKLYEHKNILFVEENDFHSSWTFRTDSLLKTEIDEFKLRTEKECETHYDMFSEWLNKTIQDKNNNDEYILKTLARRLHNCCMWSMNGFESFPLNDIYPDGKNKLLLYGTIHIYRLYVRLLNLIVTECDFLSLDANKVIDYSYLHSDEHTQSMTFNDVEPLMWKGGKYELCELIQAILLSKRIHKAGKPINQKEILEIFGALFPDETLTSSNFSTNLKRGYTANKRQFDNEYFIEGLKPKFLDYLIELIKKDSRS